MRYLSCVRAFDHARVWQPATNTLFLQIFAGSETGLVTAALTWWAVQRCSAQHGRFRPLITLYSYPPLSGVADNNGYGLKVFAFLRLVGVMHQRFGKQASTLLQHS